MRLISWNVNGIRAVQNKGFGDSVSAMAPDVLCLQETKAQDGQVVEALKNLNGYHVFSNSAERKGYSGTAILSAKEPLEIEQDMGVEEHDNEGRVLRAEFEDFHLVTVYVPNSGQELVRLDYRKEWDKDFLKYLKKLENTKPVVVCGDFNVCHQEIDIARPKANYNKSAGYTQVEIDGFSNFLDAGFVDTFRHQHPDTVKYSWWSFRANAREKNIGWRLDYFLVSQSLLDKTGEAEILNDIYGSDHCPVTLEVNL